MSDQPKQETPVPESPVQPRCARPKLLPVIVDIDFEKLKADLSNFKHTEEK